MCFHNSCNFSTCLNVLIELNKCNVKKYYVVCVETASVIMITYAQVQQPELCYVRKNK